MNEQLTKRALVIVDTQRGFIPETEGTRLGLPGFGELGVDGGENIITKINAITRSLGTECLIATTQDWHPAPGEVTTAHFSDTPNYVDTWPVHCVGGTPGAELHPNLLVAQKPILAERFIKGDTVCASPADDDSYTGALAYNPETGTRLPDWLRAGAPDVVYVAGLALGDGAEHPLCVDSTARDLKKQGFEVTLVTDAAEAVFPENRALCFQNLGSIGIRLMTTNEVLAEIAG
jgi:nicotinamidase/pyrazinamidase